jgi:hypothetical protein
MKNKPLGWIGSLGLGALLIYIFDPQMGRRRRAVVRDKVTRLRHKTVDAIGVTSRDLKNRVIGLAAETRSLVSRADGSDEILVQRVRSKLGALVSHPGSVDVKAETGRIILSGPILAGEVDRLLTRVSSMPEVKSVENRLEVHESAESIPGLQGEPEQRKGGEKLDVMQTNWAPATRFIAGTFGAATALYGARKVVRGAPPPAKPLAPVRGAFDGPAGKGVHGTSA